MLDTDASMAAIACVAAVRILGAARLARPLIALATLAAVSGARATAQTDHMIAITKHGAGLASLAARGSAIGRTVAARKTSGKPQAQPAWTIAVLLARIPDAGFATARHTGEKTGRHPEGKAGPRADGRLNSLTGEEVWPHTLHRSARPPVAQGVLGCSVPYGLAIREEFVRLPMLVDVP